jgi:hypothetical protein
MCEHIGGSMSESKMSVEVESADAAATPPPKLVWETPKIEDVSEQVMAQPYIRFT